MASKTTFGARTRLGGGIALLAAMTLMAAPGRAATTIVKAWGDDCCGQLGIGQHNNFKETPVTVSGLSGVKQVAGGGVYSLALMDDGTVMAWGNNDVGQLGDGTTTQRDSPVQVKNLANVTQISTFAWTSYALLSNGTVMAWGDGQSGELGNGSFDNASLPVPVSGLANVKQVIAGQNYAFAILSNGSVMAWGDNSAGELGVGTSVTETPVPINVPALTGVTQIAAGTEHAIALKPDGTLLAWGANFPGDLGTGEHGASESPTPVRVDIVTHALGITAGYDHSGAVLSNGTVLTWGSNQFGQLGIADRDYLASDDPIQAFMINTATTVAAEQTSTLALLKNGTVMGWGEDDFGELGDGESNPEVPAPVAVHNLSGVLQLAAGGGFGLAIVPGP